MSYKLISSDYSSTIWLMLMQPGETKPVLGSSFEAFGTYSPITNWENVFEMGDKINKELKLSEKNIVNEIQAFRKKTRS